MLAVSIKRRHRGNKAVTPRGKSIYDKGMTYKHLLKDLFRLAFKIDRVTPTHTEMIPEKNKDNQYHHAHLLIRNKAIQEEVGLYIISRDQTSTEKPFYTPLISRIKSTVLSMIILLRTRKLLRIKIVNQST